MRTPAAAIAWEFRRRHRWGLMALLATILALGAIKLAHPNVGDMTFALLVPVPLAAISLYLLAVFAFGISGDLAARESMYPRRMLTLPISTAACSSDDPADTMKWDGFREVNHDGLPNPGQFAPLCGDRT